ncbi:small-conductance mechanosensitive channel [Mizugakiibacter sediminis]|uniref:Small-conductance mechanosensitive channel n=1 Tax=Mizugakiibacter sediminis TaxID=1475481 RepID=A0A0K8QPD6_9GAMM|nr:mechanosensitive ion channel domain-containing protein [Mizugakiibacter sediminis]GAP66749.1 small-conductance mechanosensitive channel [Mizugakiibacter sediminis]
MEAFLQRIGFPNLPHEALHYGLRGAAALLILLVGVWLAARFANLLRRALERARVDATLTGFLRNLLYGVLIAVLAVATLDFAGLPTTSLVAALGAAGLAIGLALQGSLSNLAWGVLLILFRPFRAGDFVQVAGVMGTVERVDLMYTALVLPDNREAAIPNAKVGADAIINFNRRGTRRVELVVGIGYGDDIGRAGAAVHAVIEADPRVLRDPAPDVAVLELADSSVNLCIRVWVRTADVWAVQTGLLRAIKERFDAEGISIPFPQRELTVRHVQGAAAP